jgi:uridine kinase
MAHRKIIMPDLSLFTPEVFSTTLYEKMRYINPGVKDMELFEFRYGLDNLVPENGWASVLLEPQAAIEERVNTLDFYTSIQLKPRQNDHIVLDANILNLTRILLVGLATEEYPPAWINTHFSFDIRGFYFLHRTVYFTERVLAQLGRKPYRYFEQKQKRFDYLQDVGYKDFKEANTEIDQLFIESVNKLITNKGTPIVLAIAGPTAAGKTEIVERLRQTLDNSGCKTTSLEMDHFLTDREGREAKGIFTLGKEALHFELLRQSLENLCKGKKTTTPRYNFIDATSSHDLDGNLKPGGKPLEIEPAEIVFIEGNFPFILKEIVPFIGIKVVYLTDDAVRMKRKWKRDIDYRKKYEPTYFRNRFFKDQFIMAEYAYRPQMEICDIVVDTTGAALWVTPEIAEILSRSEVP